MSKMNIQEFTVKYLAVLHVDSKSQESYIKLPIIDLDELGYMQQSLLDTILLLSHERIEQEGEENLSNCLYWLSKILIASYPAQELEGITELLNNRKRV